MRSDSESWRETVPPRFQDASLEMVEPAVSTGIAAWISSLTVTLAEGYTRYRGPNLLLFGPVGTGKTYAGVAAMGDLLETGIPDTTFPPSGGEYGRRTAAPYYWSVPELVRSFHDE